MNSGYIGINRNLVLPGSGTLTITLPASAPYKNMIVYCFGTVPTSASMTAQPTFGGIADPGGPLRTYSPGPMNPIKLFQQTIDEMRPPNQNLIINPNDTSAALPLFSGITFVNTSSVTFSFSFYMYAEIVAASC